MEANFFSRNAYGITRYYPENYQAITLCKIANRKTLDKPLLDNVRKLGIEVNVIEPLLEQQA